MPLGNENECEGRHYGFTFDLNSTAMKKDGVLPNEVYDSTKVALAVCGFVDHPEGSVYITRTPLELDPTKSFRCCKPRCQTLHLNLEPTCGAPTYLKGGRI